MLLIIWGKICNWNKCSRKQIVLNKLQFLLGNVRKMFLFSSGSFWIQSILPVLLPFICRSDSIFSYRTRLSFSRTRLGFLYQQFPCIVVLYTQHTYVNYSWYVMFLERYCWIRYNCYYVLTCVLQKIKTWLSDNFIFNIHKTKFCVALNKYKMCDIYVCFSCAISLAFMCSAYMY